MKKVFLALISASILVLSSCSTKGTDAEVPTTDSTAVSVDTTSVSVSDTTIGTTVDTNVTK